MQFSIPLLSLRKPLDAVISVVDRGSSLPVTSNVLLRIRNNQLSVTGSNLQVEMTSRQNLTVDLPELTTTLPGQKLENLCKSFPDDAMLDCELKDAEFTLRSGSFAGSLNTIAAENFPLMEQASGETQVSMLAEAEQLNQMFDCCAYAMAVQDVRYFLNGMKIEVSQEKITAVATDGHRMAMAHLDQDIRVNVPGNFIIPRRGVIELVRVLGKNPGRAEFQVSKGSLLVKIGQLAFQCKLVEGEFPNYRAAIPAPPLNRMVIDCQKLIALVERAAVFSNEKPRGIRLNFEPNRLVLQTNNSQGEKAYDEMPAEFGDSGKTIGLNADYLLAALCKIETEKVEISYGGQSESCRFEEHNGSDQLAVIMSMKV